MASKRRKKRPVKKDSAKAIAKKRSKAAKKGWETRRLTKTQLKAEKRLTKLYKDIQKAIKAQKAQGKKPKITRIQALKATELKIRKTAKTLKRKGYTKEQIDEIGEAFREEMLEPLDLVDTPEADIMRRLILAEDEGHFDETAYELAEEYDWEPQEIYSLWHGYEPE